MAQQVTYSYRVQGEGHPIDLTREEFIHFQLLMSRVSGGMRTRTLSLIISLVLSALVIAGEVALWREGQPTDVLLLGAGLLLAGISLLLWCYVPFRIRRSAGQLYDRTVNSGISHYGLLRITPHGIIKEKATITATVPLNNATLFVEDEEMQLVFNRMGQAIVLPARCMTPPLSQQVREAAQQLPPGNYKYFGRLLPRGEAVTPPPDVTATVLLDKTVQYTTEEYVSLTKALTVQRFWARSPLYCILSMLVALMISWNVLTLWSCMLSFLLVFGVLVLLNLVIPLRRIPMAVETMPAQALSLQMTLDDRGLRVQKAGQGELGLPWEAVTHVYNGDTTVEITGKGQFFRIPKRHIDDFEEFSRDIDRYFHK